MTDILNTSLKTAIKPNLFKNDDYHYGLSTPPIWERRINGYLADVFQYDYNQTLESSRALHLQANFDGSGTLFCGWMGETIKNDYSNPRKNFYRLRTAILTARFLAFWGDIYHKADYFGKIDIGLALTNLKESIDSETSSIDIRPNTGFYASDYKQTMRVSAAELKEKPKQLTEDLLTRLFESIAPMKKNLFKLQDWNK